MSTIAKGMITLSSLNDAYTVSLSPNSCVIRADYDGSNAQLTNAFTHVTVSRGTVATEFTMEIESITNNNIRYTVSSVDTYTKCIQLTHVPSNVISGALEFLVTVGNEYSTLITFQFSVVRESTMLDWIQDWESNKTVIGSTYLITPKIFVGSRVTSSNDLNSLTGVYIGPDENNGAGIYGLKLGDEIFHLNQYGGSIGGWDIMTGGIQTSDGLFQILSIGSVIVKDSNSDVIWGIYKSGEASFARGNVQFHTDGSASFTGSITASSGLIGGQNGWSIQSGSINSEHILLHSQYNYIGISAAASPTTAYLTHKSGIVDNGGVYLHYTSANSYGILGYLPKDANDNTRCTFQLGSSNTIAGWSFDNEAIWLGTKLNQTGQYAATNSITIGTNGLRGTNWYIDKTGDVSFLAGLVSFSSSGSSLVGWSLQTERLSTNYVAILSNSSRTGIYLSKTNISNITASSLVSTIQGNGGVYLQYNGTDVEFVGYKGAVKVFQLSSTNDSRIASWYFNNTSLYMGILTTTGFTAQSGHITIGNTGLRGYKWRLESDGSGALAGGKIAWSQAGNVTIGSDVVVRQLDTLPVDGNARIEISGSEINVFGLNGVCNIRFGVNEEGYAILRYYDKNGNQLYDLGPEGLKNIAVVEEAYRSYSDLIKFTSSNIESVSDFFAFARNLTNSSAMDVVRDRGTDTTETFYYYKAKRINGRAYPNTYAATAEEAANADGKAYEQSNVAVSSNTLVSGVFRYNNSKNDWNVITSLNKEEGVIPSEYTQYESYYENNTAAHDHNIEIDWSFDLSAAIEYTLLNPVYWRYILIFKDGRLIDEFPFFWQEEPRS